MKRPKRWYRNMNPAIAAQIRRRYFRREATQSQLAAEYNIRQNTVSRIVSGQVWVA